MCDNPAEALESLFGEACTRKGGKKGGKKAKKAKKAKHMNAMKQKINAVKNKVAEALKSKSD